jgi:two-component system CheB/CheR fusion protein
MTTDNSIAEFRRQMRSLFAVLRAIIRRNTSGRESVDDYAARLEARVGALARVQDMLMRAPEYGIDLEELLRDELLAQAVGPQGFQIAGPDTRIGREAAVPVALALHELTVNALMHGALATPRGRVEIAWEHVEDKGERYLRFSWQESGVEIVSQPTLTGFGLELLERTLPYELGVKTRIDWAPAGACVEIRIPMGATTTFWRPAEQGVQS